MARPERLIDPDSGPLAEFANDLRALRESSGKPSYRDLAKIALFAPSVLSSAASGHRLPTLPVTLAFVAACGGDQQEWEHRWRWLARHLGVHEMDAAPAGQHSSATGKRGRRSVPTVTRLPRPTQIPRGLTTFVGRESTTAEAISRMRLDADHRLPLLITGPVGIGKTALALRLAAMVSNDYPDGQLFANLNCTDPGTGAQHVATGFLHALGLPPELVPADPTQQINLYRSMLAERRLLVLLDGVKDEEQIRPLIGASGQSLTLVTSRARLLGLDDTHRVELCALSNEASVTLLGRIAGAARMRAEGDAVSAIADACGNSPLALNLLGRRLAARPEQTIRSVADQLGRPDLALELIAVGDVKLRDRFAAAYRRLPEHTRSALLLLTHDLSDGTTAAAAASVLNMPQATAETRLESSVDAGLLWRSATTGRYYSPRLVGAFLREMLDVERRSARALEVPRRRVLRSVPRSGPVPHEPALSGFWYECG
ncbi:NB-ARC domain-containing protein [Kitasatospora sp. NPDC002040]|uniref:NB-ARC domain-containing protein n=1 Tax=Kitasatospora sp. NPDC002040 TaxID=3154661 RepID=UPI00331CB270